MILMDEKMVSGSAERHEIHIPEFPSRDGH